LGGYEVPKGGEGVEETVKMQRKLGS